MLTLILFGGLMAAYPWGLRPGLLVATFIAAPLVILAHAGQIHLQLFTWVKVLTLAISMLLLAAFIALRHEAWRPRLALCLVAILALNILEAVVADAAAGHWLNSLVGISLIATLARPRAVSPSADGRHMLYDLSWPWILCYTVWNLTVVCGIYPTRWTDHLAVLAVPVVAALLWGRERWLEARGFSLSVYVCGLVVAYDVFQLPWLPRASSPSGLYPWLSGLTVVVAFWNLVPRLTRLRRARLFQ